MKQAKITLLVIGLLVGTIIGIVSSKADAYMVQPLRLQAEAVKQSSDPAKEYPQWDKTTVYVGGDHILWQDMIYRAKWWTQGETPGKADVWESTGKVPQVNSLDGSSIPVAGSASEKKTGIPTVNTHDAKEFKVVGYYPSWKPGETNKIRYDVMTHVIYAFAIPTVDGSIRPLENPDTAQKIIQTAHDNNVKVLLAVGGWSYNDVPLESTFISATNTEKKRAEFADSIVDMCNQYGFDGIDMDWEHPRVDGSSKSQYEALMLTLADKLHAQDKLLTAAVLSGATPDGNIYYDAAGQSDAVLNAVDWIHVMAYDGGDGQRHSDYEFAVNSADYWKVARKVPPEKIVLGIPFYGRPSWESYENILKANSKAGDMDSSQINGVIAWYNGISTVQKKTEFAEGQLGGVMIWELTQDTSNRSESLVEAIKKTIS